MQVCFNFEFRIGNVTRDIKCIGCIQKQDCSPSAHWAIEDDWLDLKVITNHLWMLNERSVSDRASGCTYLFTITALVH